MTEGVKISPDRMIVIAIGLLVAFNTFRDETKKTDNDFTVQLTRIELQLDAMRDSSTKFQKFMESPRFTSTMFSTEMSSRDNLDARQDLALDKLRDGKQLNTEKIESLRQEFIEFKFSQKANTD